MSALSDLVPGVPALLNPIPNLPSVSSIMTLPNVTSLLNVPSIPALQGLPNVMSLINTPSIAAIPSIPGISGLLNVPSLSDLVRVPDVTNLLNIGNIGNKVGNIFSDATSVIGLFSNKVKWGIFLNGQQAIKPDSFVALEYRNEWNVSNYPQEQGAFESYNKVATPYDVRVRLSKRGTPAEVGAFLTLVDALAASLAFYDVVTPEKTYRSSTVTNVGYRRSSESGASMIVVDLSFAEIRVTAAPASTNQTKSAAGASPISGGTLQLSLPSLAQIAPVQAAIDKVKGIASKIPHF